MQSFKLIALLLAVLSVAVASDSGPLSSALRGSVDADTDADRELGKKNKKKKNKNKKNKKNKKTRKPKKTNAPVAAPTDDVPAPTDDVPAPTDDAPAPTDSPVAPPTDDVPAPTDDVQSGAPVAAPTGDDD